MAELGHEQKQVIVFCDSQSTTYLSKNQVHHEKNKACRCKGIFHRT